MKHWTLGVFVIFGFLIAYAAQAQSIPPTDYELVAPGQTHQVIGLVGTKGNIVDSLVITPLSVSPGEVRLQDGSHTHMTVFVGGTNSVNELRPMVVHLGTRSISGAWKVSTGANITVIAIGKFQ